jgi:hypothetical protein
MNNFISLLGVSLILMHEMDAVRCHEWRIFPGLSLMSDKVGFSVFMLLHIPLFMYLLSGFGGEPFRRSFDFFLIIHFVLHLLFLKHPKNEFKDWISWAIISGAGICGLTDILL